MRIKHHFHINGYVPSLAMKKWLGATKKGPIHSRTKWDVLSQRNEY